MRGLAPGRPASTFLSAVLALLVLLSLPSRAAAGPGQRVSLDASNPNAAASPAAPFTNASLAFVGATYGFAASNGSVIRLEWRLANASEVGSASATLLHEWHSGTPLVNDPTLVVSLVNSTRVWARNASNASVLVPANLTYTRTFAQLGLADNSSVASRTVSAAALFYDYAVPYYFPPGSRFRLTLFVPGRPNVANASALLFVPEAGARALAPSVLVAGSPGVGSADDGVPNSGAGLAAAGTQGSVLGGATLTLSARGYNFAAGDRVAFYVFRSPAGESCSLATNFSLCHPSQACSSAQGINSPSQKKALGLRPETDRVNYNARALIIVGWATATQAAPPAGEVFSVNYTVPAPQQLYLQAGPFYLFGALWFDESTITSDGSPAATPSGFPSNATARSPCFSIYGSSPGQFPAIGAVHVPATIVPTSTTSVLVMWDVGPTLLPSTSYEAAPLVLSLHRAGDYARLAVIDWAVPNLGSYRWYAGPDLLSTVFPANTNVQWGAAQYYLTLNTTGNAFGASGRSSVFVTALPENLIDITMLSQVDSSPTFAGAAAPPPRVILLGQQSVRVDFSVAARPDDGSGFTASIPSSYAVDVMCAFESDFSDSAKQDTVPNLPRPSGSPRRWTSSAFYFAPSATVGNMSWSPGPSIAPPAGLPPNSTCWFRAYSSANAFRYATSSPFAVLDAPSSSPLALLAQRLGVVFTSPAHNSTVVQSPSAMVNFTYTISLPAGALPPELNALSVRLYRSAGAGVPFTASSAQQVFLDAAQWPSGYQSSSWPGDLDTVCLFAPCYYGSSSPPLMASAGGGLFATRTVLVPSRAIPPGGNYFLVLTSPLRSFRWLRFRGPLFSVFAHKIALSDDNHFLNSTLYLGAGAVIPYAEADYKWYFCNLTSTLDDNYAPENLLDIYLLSANSQTTPEYELSQGRVPGIVHTLSTGNPGRGYLRPGDLYWAATNFTYSINFTLPLTLPTNRVYALCVWNAYYRAYAWSYIFLGDVEGVSPSVSVVRPSSSELVFFAGSVLIVQWITSNLPFDVGMSVYLDLGVSVPTGVLTVPLGVSASNVDATVRWPIPLGFCGGLFKDVCTSDPAGNATLVRVVVKANKTEAVYGRSGQFVIRPPAAAASIAVLEPALSSVWNVVNESARVSWASTGLAAGAMCSVSVFRTRFFVPSGDLFVAELTPPGGVLCAGGSFTAAVPLDGNYGWPAYVVVAGLVGGAWTSGSVWGRSDLFTLKPVEPPNLFQLIKDKCYVHNAGGFGAPASLCASSCAACSANYGALWVQAATVSLDFDVPYWPFRAADLVVLKVALGATRTRKVNLCWPYNTDPATQPFRPAAERVYLSTVVIEAWSRIAPLLPAGVTVSPYLALETSGSYPASSACVNVNAMATVSVSAVAGSVVTPTRAKGIADRVKMGVMRAIGAPSADVDVSVDLIQSTDSGNSANGLDAGSANLVAGANSPVPLADAVLGRKLPVPGTGSPGLMRRRLLEDADAARGAVRFADAAANDWRLHAATAAATREVHSNRMRRLGVLPDLPTGGAVTTLVQMTARVAVPDLSIAKLALQTLLLDGVGSVDGGGSGGDASSGNSSMFSLGPYGPAALTLGTSAGYVGGAFNQLTSWENVLPVSSPSYLVNWVQADTGQPLSSVGSAASIVANTAWTDGSAAFQLQLYSLRRPPPPPRLLTPGEIAAIVLCLLLFVWFLRFLYFDYRFHIYFFPEPLMLPPPPTEPPFDPTLKSIDDALNMHDATAVILPDEAKVPGYAMEARTRTREMMEEEEVAPLPSAAPAPTADSRFGSGPGARRKVGVASPARVHPTERENERRHAHQAQAAADEAIAELTGMI